MSAVTCPRVGILGVGNILLRDEGFGVHCIHHLQQRYDFPEAVRLLDGGTAGIMLSPFIEDQDQLFIIDVVALEGPPGTVHCFSEEAIRRDGMNLRMSPHQLGLLEILELCRLRGRIPGQIELLTVIPQDLRVGIGLSPALEKSMEAVETRLLASLRALGVGPLAEKGSTDA